MRKFLVALLFVTLSCGPKKVEYVEQPGIEVSTEEDTLVIESVEMPVDTTPILISALMESIRTLKMSLKEILDRLEMLEHPKEVVKIETLIISPETTEYETAKVETSEAESVKFVEVKKEVPRYVIQLGAFVEPQNADEFCRKLEKEFGDIVYAGLTSKKWFLYLGNFFSEYEARGAKIVLDKLGYKSDIDYVDGFYCLRLGVFNDENKAKNFYKKLVDEFGKSIILKCKVMWRVGLGYGLSEDEARSALKVLRKLGYKDAFVIKL